MTVGVCLTATLKGMNLILMGFSERADNGPKSDKILFMF